MSVYAVSYDPVNPGQNYADLIKAIKTYTHCKALYSMYFIDTPRSCSDVLNHLKANLDRNDQLYVMHLQHHWAAARADDATAWLKSPQRTWG